MGMRDVESSREQAEPLIQSEGSYKSDDEHQWMVYLSTFVAVCGSFQFGCCVGYSSPVQFQIMEELSLNVSEGVTALDIGRLATGYGMGVISFVVPVFIAEFAPKNLRGSLGSLNQLMIVLGISAAFVLGSVLTWRVLAWAGIIPSVILLIGLSFIPESPRWLAKVGQQKACEAALQKLRGLNADISQEASEIQENIESLERLPKAGVKDLLQRRNLQPLFELD